VDDTDQEKAKQYFLGGLATTFFSNMTKCQLILGCKKCILFVDGMLHAFSMEQAASSIYTCVVLSAARTVSSWTSSCPICGLSK
jgi:hypothetical protein